jgi:DNA primase
MNNGIISCREAKEKDLVEYLAALGHQPQKIHGNDYWFFSPLHEEKTPSFKVNKKFNVWYDHGIGKGGNLVDFGISYHRCSVSEFLQNLSGNSSFHQHQFPLSESSQQKEPADDKSRIKILSETSIESAELLHYLDSRKIPFELADKFCRQVDFELYGKKITALGFPNRSGGFELRSATFKGSSSPKDISFIDNRTEQIAVFEGFFSFLSFATINQNLHAPLTNCLVLNSLAFFEKSRSLMEKYEQVHLVLDNDVAGKKYTAKALQWSDRYIDRSDFYGHHKDLNDWLKENSQQPRQQRRQGRNL